MGILRKDERVLKIGLRKRGKIGGGEMLDGIEMGTLGAKSCLMLANTTYISL